MRKYDIEHGPAVGVQEELVDNSYIMQVLDTAYDAFFVTNSTDFETSAKVERMQKILLPIFADVLQYNDEKSIKVINAYLQGKGVLPSEVENVPEEKPNVEDVAPVAVNIPVKEKPAKKVIGAYQYCLDKLVESGELKTINKKLKLGVTDLTIENVTQAMAEMYGLETRFDAERLLVQYQACDIYANTQKPSIFTRVINWFKGEKTLSKVDVLEYALKNRTNMVKATKEVSGKEYVLIPAVKNSTAILEYKIKYKKLKRNQTRSLTDIYNEALKDVYRLPVKQAINEALGLGLKKNNLSNEALLNAMVEKYNLANTGNAELILAQYAVLRFIGEKEGLYYNVFEGKYEEFSAEFSAIAKKLGKKTSELQKTDILLYALQNKINIFEAYSSLSKHKYSLPVKDKYRDIFNMVNTEIQYVEPSVENPVERKVEPPKPKKVNPLEGKVVVGDIALTDETIRNLTNCCQLFKFFSTKPEEMVENIRVNFGFKTQREAVLFANEIAQIKVTSEQSKFLKKMAENDKSIIYANPVKVVANYALNKGISPIEAYNEIFKTNVVSSAVEGIVDIDSSNARIEGVSKQEIDLAVKESLSKNMHIETDNGDLFLGKGNRDVEAKLQSLAEVFGTTVENIKFNMYQYQSIRFQTKGKAYNSMCEALGRERVTKIDIFNYALNNKISMYEAYEKLSGTYVTLASGYKKLLEEKQVQDGESAL